MAKNVRSEIMIYKFYDTDSAGTAEYDISGFMYECLLRLCFDYCTSVSFCLSPDLKKDLSKFQKDKLQVTQSVKEQYRHYGRFSTGDTDENTGYTIAHYRLSSDIKQWLQTAVDSLFKWTYAWGNDNFDDPAFFRPDGSVFFSSIIHEGECTLFPMIGEEIGSVIHNGNWVNL